MRASSDSRAETPQQRPNRKLCSHRQLGKITSHCLGSYIISRLVIAARVRLRSYSVPIESAALM
jgi:hypothetical protein